MNPSIGDPTFSCGEAEEAAAGPLCCMKNTAGADLRDKYSLPWYGPECLFAMEYVTYATAKERCESQSNNYHTVFLCPRDNTFPKTSWGHSCGQGQPMWTGTHTCSLSVMVHAGGYISMFDPGYITKFTSPAALSKLAGTTFLVRWENGLYPKAAYNCKISEDSLSFAGCTLEDQTCVCHTKVSKKVVFTGSSIPTLAEVKASLFIGAADVTTFENGTYTLHGNNGNVQAWVKANSNSFGMDTIFELPPRKAGASPTYLANFESTVFVGSEFSALGSFRNPPTFLPLHGNNIRDIRDGPEWINFRMHSIGAAEDEIDAVLDHLTEHQNTAPFVAYRLIQRMVTSNPSPRYVKVVADAFKSGTYNGRVLSGKYGDLAATVSAILLDREAREPIMSLDPTYGKVREPVVKVLHVLRSMGMLCLFFCLCRVVWLSHAKTTQLN